VENPNLGAEAMIAGGAVFALCALAALQARRSVRRYERRLIAMRWDQIAAQRKTQSRWRRTAMVIQRRFAKSHSFFLLAAVACFGAGSVVLFQR
jgi:hypothetical protein